MDFESDKKLGTLAEACGALTAGDSSAAESFIHERYPFVPFSRASRSVSMKRVMRIYVRDGFIDRYSGRRLVFPGSLRLMSELMPTAFPYHPNWRTDECHFAYWEYFPILDYVKPISRGGIDIDDNLVTTSAVRNAAKANFSLDELGWSLRPSGDLGEWDGLMGWFLDMSARHSAVFEDSYFSKWMKIVKDVVAGKSPGTIVPRGNKSCAC